MLRAVVTLLLLVAGCATTRAPQLRVVGMNAVPHEVVFVQVTNPASRPMRLTKLEYVFAAGATKVSEGEVRFAREVAAGEAVVVAVPFELASGERPTMLRGKLIAEVDAMVRTFAVSAAIAAE